MSMGPLRWPEFIIGAAVTFVGFALLSVQYYFYWTCNRGPTSICLPYHPAWQFVAIVGAGCVLVVLSVRPRHRNDATCEATVSALSRKFGRSPATEGLDGARPFENLAEALKSPIPYFPPSTLIPAQQS